MFDLSGKVALITGAGRGVGAGIARSLVACGATVAINDLVAHRAESTAVSLGAVAVAGDVTVEADVAAMVNRVRSTVGDIDILVNNAGVPAQGAPLVRFRDSDRADWQHYIDLNLIAVMACTKAVLDTMCERGWGRIVTVTSEAGRTGQPPGLSLYAAAKAGAAGFTRTLAREVGRDGVTVNCVSLGTIDNNPERETVLKATPMRRYGTPDDAGAAVAYLASEEAGWVTGQTLPVNGGYFTL